MLFDTKDKIAIIVINLIVRLANEQGHPIIRIRVDNEFVQNLIQAHCTTTGITMETSVPHAHHMVGAIERSHRTVRERASAMIEDFSPSSATTQALVNRTEETLRNASLPEGPWTYAIRGTVNKKNRAPSRALKFEKPPYEALYSTRPNLAKDNAWGARVYVTIPPELRAAATTRKLHTPRAYIAHFLCAEGEDICWLWHSEKREVKHISMARIDNSTGMDDPQPHGQHINNQDPPPTIPNDFQQIDSDSEDNGNGNDDDNASETSPYFGLALSANNLPNKDENEDNNRLQQSPPTTTSRHLEHEHHLVYQHRLCAPGAPEPNSISSPPSVTSHRLATLCEHYLTAPLYRPNLLLFPSTYTRTEEYEQPTITHRLAQHHRHTHYA
jgi:hypothetical protein